MKDKHSFSWVDRFNFYSILACILIFSLLTLRYLNAIRADIVETNMLNKINLDLIRATLQATKSKFDRQDKMFEKLVVDYTRKVDNLKETIYTLSSTYDQIINDFYREVVAPDYKRLATINVTVLNYTTRSMGSGVLLKYHNRYYVLTAAHMFTALQDDVQVQDNTNKLDLDVTLVKIDKKHDLALLKLNSIPEGLPFAELAEIGPPIGGVVYVIGNPDGKQDVVTAGIITHQSNLYYLTTNNIFYGNSGGGCFYKGKLVGIVSGFEYSVRFIPKFYVNPKTGIIEATKTVPFTEIFTRVVKWDWVVSFLSLYEQGK